MPALPSPTAWRLDRLDEQAFRLRTVLLEMMVTVSVPSPDLRSHAFEACVSAGLLTSPHCSFLRDFSFVISALVGALQTVTEPPVTEIAAPPVSTCVQDDGAGKGRSAIRGVSQSPPQ